MADTNGTENRPAEKEKVDEDFKGHRVDVSQGDIITDSGEIVNASGHKDQLRRQYGLLSICGLALTVDNAWVAAGSSIVVAISESTAGASFEKTDLTNLRA